jgi:hypothetical protein
MAERVPMPMSLLMIRTTPSWQQLAGLLVQPERVWRVTVLRGGEKQLHLPSGGQ